jgi:hypothetical protein
MLEMVEAHMCESTGKAMRVCLCICMVMPTGMTLPCIRIQGVSAPCQIRYVYYIDAMLETPSIDYRSPKAHLLEKIIIKTMPLFAKDAVVVTFVVEVGGRVVFDYAKAKGLARLSKQVRSLSAIRAELACIALHKQSRMHAAQMSPLGDA